MRRYALAVFLVVSLIAAPPSAAADWNQALTLFGAGIEVTKKAGETIEVWIRVKRVLRSESERSQLEGLSRDLTRLTNTKCGLVDALRLHANIQSQATWGAVSAAVPPLLTAVTATYDRVDALTGSFTAQESPTWHDLLEVLNQKRYGVLLVLFGREASPLDAPGAIRTASRLDDEVASIRTLTASLGDYLKRTAPGSAGTTAGTSEISAGKRCARN